MTHRVNTGTCAANMQSAGFETETLKQNLDTLTEQKSQTDPKVQKTAIIFEVSTWKFGACGMVSINSRKPRRTVKFSSLAPLRKSV